MVLEQEHKTILETVSCCGGHSTLTLRGWQWTVIALHPVQGCAGSRAVKQTSQSTDLTIQPQDLCDLSPSQSPPSNLCSLQNNKTLQHCCHLTQTRWVCVKVAVCFIAGLNKTYIVNLLHHTNVTYLASNAFHFKAVSLVTYMAVPVNAPSFKALQKVDCLKNGKGTCWFCFDYDNTIQSPSLQCHLEFLE